MLENLVNLVKEYAGDAVVNNPDIPNEHNNAVIGEATKTVAGGLQNMAAGGGLENILNLFKGKNEEGGISSGGLTGIMKNPIVSMMIGHFAGKLMSKFNMNSSQAGSVSNNLIPNVMSNLVNRTNDPNNNNFNLNDILSSLTGGSGQQSSSSNSGGGFDINNILAQFTGGNNSGGLSDIISKFTHQAQQNKQTQITNSESGGGLMDLIKGFL